MARKSWGAGQDFVTKRGQHIIRRRAPDGRLVTGTSMHSRKEALARWKRNAEPVSSSTSDPEPVAAYLARWLSERAMMQTLGPRTIRTYRLVIDGWVTPVIGDIPLDELTADDVQRTILRALARGKSAQWAKHVHTVIRSALSDARQRRLVTENVASLVTAPKVPRHDVVRLTTDQVNKFLDDHATHRLYALWVLALTTGMRQGELLALQWPDIDWKASTITVSRTLLPLRAEKRPGCQRARTTRWEVLEPKTETSRRTIDLSGFALEALRAHRAKASSAVLVFARDDGRGPWSPTYVFREWKRLLALSGLPVVPFHASRHTAIAEALDMSGGDLRAARDMAGHSRLGTTTDIYGGLARRATRRIAEGMDERFGKRKAQ